MDKLPTRPNSRVLLVTSVRPRLRAWAAMNRSLAPIIVPRALQVGANLGVVQRCFVGKIQNLDVAQKSVERRFVLPPPRRHFDPEQEFGLGDYGDADVADGDFREPLAEPHRSNAS